MKTIPAESVERLWDNFFNTPPEQFGATFERLMEQQPAVVVYLMTIEDMENPGEKTGNLCMIGVAALAVMLGHNPRLRQIMPEELEAREEENIKFLENLEEGPEMNYLSTVTKMYHSYNQPTLFEAVVSSLMSGNEDTPEMAPDEIGMALLRIKTAIDCLDNA